MNAEEIGRVAMRRRVYLRQRAKGWRARESWHAAVAETAFAELGDPAGESEDWAERNEHVVRLDVVPDEEFRTLEDLAGDTFDPKAHPEISRARMERERKAFEDNVNREGVWGLVGCYRDPESGEWVTADSCWGFIGEQDAWDSGYAFDCMSGTVRQYREACSRFEAREEARFGSMYGAESQVS